MRRAVAFLTIAASMASRGSIAHAQSGRDCIRQHEAGQAQKDSGQLRSARESLVACASDSCPVAIRKECATLLAEVDTSLPSIVIEVTGALDAQTSAKVFVDGAALENGLDGRAVPLDPGKHVLRVVAGDGRSRELSVTMHEGEKRRKVVVAFKDQKAPPAPTVEHEPSEPPRPNTAVWLLSGVGALGLASFATFGLMGVTKESALSDRCAPSCATDDADAVRRNYMIADVSLAVGVVCGVIAAVLAWPRSTEKRGRF